MTYPAGGATPSSKINGYQQVKTPNFTNGQMKLFQQLLGSAGGGAEKGLDFLSKLAGGDEAAFAQSEQPAYNAFNKNIGNIASRFSQAGGRNSSAFDNAVAGASAEMGQNLQANRASIQQQAIQSLLGQSNTLLGQKPYDNALLADAPDDSPDFGALLAQILPLLMSMMGPGGTVAGGVASGLSQKFK
jgi:phage-related protein